MDIQKIKELALANGFSLKEQASGNMDLHSYVYEFAQAIESEVLAQARSVFGQDGVTTFDTETLDSEISSISSEFEAKYFFDNDDADRLEMLVAKSMKLGELYERQKWQAAKNQAIPEGFVLLPSEPSEAIKVALSYQCFDFIKVAQIYRECGFDIPKKAEDEQSFFLHKFLLLAVKHGVDFIKVFNAETKAMIEAQEQGDD